MCGVFGITHAEHAARLAYLGLFALQHRGQESAGIATVDEQTPHTYRGTGLVADVFNEERLTELTGSHAIGHVRYSTAGGQSSANIQPLFARVGGVPVAVAHNGNVVNADAIRQKLEKEGSILQGTADTEIILHLMAKSQKVSFLDRFVEALQTLVGAFSLLMLTPTHLYAAVDACGYRPLALGRKNYENGTASWIVASETCAMDLVGADFVRDIAPGEIICIDLGTGELKSVQLPILKEESTHGQRARCVFEHIYFARPDSVLWGSLSQDVRFALGATLAKTHPVDADMVIAVPDSGVPMAMGYAEAAGIPYRIGLTRNHYVGRTFIEPTQNVRNFRVRLKLNPVRKTVQGKRVIVIDDSIVRGTTSRRIIELLREAGAKEVHMRIGSPPIRFPCFYGIDTPKRRELLADHMSIEDMARYLKTDSLGFLSEESLLGCMNSLPETLERQKLAEEKQKGGWCTACFSGHYQDTQAQNLGHANPQHLLDMT